MLVLAMIILLSAAVAPIGSSLVRLSDSEQPNGHEGFVSSRGDSRRLVIGVNQTRPRAYDDLINLLAAVGGKNVSKISTGSRTIAMVVDIPSSNLSFFQREVQSAWLARYVEPDMVFEALSVPNDPYYLYQWALPRIQADWAWNKTTGDPSLLVAVIDSGIDYNHPDLKNHYIPLGYDWVNGDNDPLDDYGHGTACAGIIGAELGNAIGISGIAQVAIMAEKGLNDTGYGYETDLANAIIHAVFQGARIISISWGSDYDSALIHDAITYAYENGVLVVAAAGNSNSNLKVYPAAYDEVVAVGATDQTDEKASFSNWGSWIGVAAPGIDILSTMPTYHVTLNDEGYSLDYDFISGTSAACPHAVGVAALIWSRFPSATRDWVRGQLSLTADDLGDPGFDSIYGSGRVNARKAVEQEPFEHDLFLYRYDAPSHIEPGDTVSFKVTALNFGFADENNVNTSLLVDGTTIDSTLIDDFAANSFTTVTLIWNPVESRTYNVTLYVLPVPDETMTNDNVISIFVNVHFRVVLNPPRGPVGTGVNVTGVEFTPDSAVSVTFNDMFIGEAVTDASGNFTFLFNVPFSTPQTWVVKAFDANIFAQANFTVLDITPLNVQVDIGAIHFRGEVVGFHVYTIFNGNAVNATVTSATLYDPYGAKETLSLQEVATGLSTSSYVLPSDALTGSYALVVNATYSTGTVESAGTGFKSFLVSATLSGWDAMLIGVNQSVGTIRTDIGLINMRLDALNASLVSIDGEIVILNSSVGTIRSDLDTIGLKVTAINGTTATIDTVVGAINGTVTSINDQKATIVIQGIGQIQTDISDLKATSQTWTIPLYVILASVLVATAAVLLAVGMLSRRKTVAEEQAQPQIPAPY